MLPHGTWKGQGRDKEESATLHSNVGCTIITFPSPREVGVSDKVIENEEKDRKRAHQIIKLKQTCCCVPACCTQRQKRSTCV